MTVRDVWRWIRTPLTLLVLLGVLGYGAWWGYRTVLTAGNPKGPVTCVTQSAKVVVPSQVNLQRRQSMSGLKSAANFSRIGLCLSLIHI